MPEESKSLAEIEAHRAKIDEIDQQLVKLFSERMPFARNPRTQTRSPHGAL